MLLTTYEIILADAPIVEIVQQNTKKPVPAELESILQDWQTFSFYYPELVDKNNELNEVQKAEAKLELAKRRAAFIKDLDRLRYSTEIDKSNLERDFDNNFKMGQFHGFGFTLAICIVLAIANSKK
jgi:Zn/Cd-binding protein ZinT